MCKGVIRPKSLRTADLIKVEYRHALQSNNYTPKYTDTLTLVCTRRCTRMFITLFVISNTWKQQNIKRLKNG